MFFKLSKPSHFPRILATWAWLAPVAVFAHEGMWLPTLLQAVEGDMRTAGLEISAEDIYSINNGSLKDAVALFGGGCTAEVVSTQGLILTNHHCGHAAIQGLSSVDHNYLEDGFMAATQADELPAPGLSVTFIVRMEDVSDRVNAALRPEMAEAERKALARKEGGRIAAEAVEGTRLDAVVRPFNYGNSWFLIVSETYRDIRLVATPPAGIGEFGGDADNWAWPRHTGDFSVFRIYAGPDGKPAEFAPENAPFRPRRSIAIDISGAREGEFAMVYGFPGYTEYYVTSHAVREVEEVIDPLRITMRTASLDVINAAMDGGPAMKLRYAPKQRRIANGWKKWQGEVRGLKAMDAVGRKLALEAEFVRRAQGNPAYAGILERIAGLHAAREGYAKQAGLHAEFFHYGPALPRFAWTFRKLVEEQASMDAPARAEEAKRMRAGAASFFRENDMDVDRGIFAAQLPIVLREQVPALAPAAWRDMATRDGDARHYASELYGTSILADSAKLFALLDHFGPKDAARLARDPAYRLAKSLMEAFDGQVRGPYAAINDSLQAAMRTWSRGLVEFFPEKQWWPDANLTLRLSYGKVEGAEPEDGIEYQPFTTLDGVMAKHDPENPDFRAPAKLIELYQAKDFGPYATDGQMRTCFLASLHTTGGNSGSPVFNGRGELIGINFDRMWESTMSDLLFDPALCRNISVDIKYVLFIIDKFLGGKRLVDEMELTGQAVPSPLAPQAVPQ